MRWLGILLILIGTWFFFNPEFGVDKINKGIYKKKTVPIRRSHIIGARILALLWLFVGVLIFLK